MSLRVTVDTGAGEATKITTLTVRERRTPHRRPYQRR
jgi:hypothetical protein